MVKGTFLKPVEATTMSASRHATPNKTYASVLSLLSMDVYEWSTKGPVSDAIYCRHASLSNSGTTRT